MWNRFAIIFDQRVPAYSVILATAIIFAVLWMVLRAPQGQRIRTLDVCLAAIIGGILVGRLLHVGFNWDFFVNRPELILRIDREGGLNWQGAALGAIVFALMIAKFRRVTLRLLVQNSVVVLPWLALAAWYACGTANCAYGQEVQRMADYPPWLVWIADDIYRLDAPRFATQPLGMAGAAILLLLAIILMGYPRLGRAPIWLMLALVALLSFVIGFLRGDGTPVLAGLRIGQWLDIALLLIGGMGFIWNMTERGSAREISTR